jgi:ribosomal protein L11 methyltransferase
MEAAEEQSPAASLFMKDSVQYQSGFKMSLALPLRVRVMALFKLIGYDQSVLVEEEQKTFRMVSLYLKDSREAKLVMGVLKTARIKGAVPFSRVHRFSVWSTGWKKGWKPFAVTKKLHVVPLWQEDRSYPKTKTPIYLETTNAFGTGLHETTRFTAQLIEGLSGKFKSFLDVGTGSGILAIVAIKCGAVKVTGFDIDPSAVKVARQNLKVNSLMCSLKACDVNSFMPRKLFDCVAANLVSPDLIEFRDRIISFVSPGGYLIISGISLKNIPRVKRSFAEKGLRPAIVSKGREWSAMLFKL